MQKRDGPTMWSDLLQVSADSKVDQAAQPIVSRCQAFTLSVKSDAPSAFTSGSQSQRELQELPAAMWWPGGVVATPGGRPEGN